MSKPEQWDNSRATDALLQIFQAAIDSAAPGPAVTSNLPAKPIGRCVVVGAGKASAAMAAALDTAWNDVELTGVVSTRYGHAVAAGRIEIIEAGHPVPDENSERAANSMLNALAGLTDDDLVIALISGGGSASLAAPVDGLSLDDKRRITRQLLKSGATIAEMNTVRAHLSKVKGGKLGDAAKPARLVTLIVSDVPGDDPAIVASGPTLPATSTSADALAIVQQYGIEVPGPLLKSWSDPPTTPSQQPNSDVTIIASASQALDAATKAAQSLGLRPVCLGDDLEGESRKLAAEMADAALNARDNEDLPVVLLSGGETTVTVGEEGGGRGGRNCEFQLALAIALDGAQGIWSLAGDSDGIDGTEDAAGAVVGPDTLGRASAAGANARDALQRHDSYTFFEAIDDLVITGPTLTNVNDIRIIMVTPA